MAIVASGDPTVVIQPFPGKGVVTWQLPWKASGQFLCLESKLEVQVPDEADFIIHSTDSTYVSLRHIFRARR